MKKTTTIILLLLTAITLFGNTNYYKLIRNAEQKIVDKQLDSSIYYYKEAFIKYNYPFVKDLLAASCIAIHTNDTTTLYTFLELLLNKGMSEKELEYFVKKKPNDKRILAFKTNFDNYNNYYLSTIDYQLNKKFRDIDKNNQIWLQSKNKADSICQLYTYTKLTKQFIDLVKQNGYPTERRVGLGSLSTIMYSNEEHPHSKNNWLLDSINLPFLKSKRLTKSFFKYSHKNTTICFLMSRRGNAYLWHVDLRKAPELDSILLKGIQNCEVYPTFYAARRERSGDDYGLVFMSAANMKYNYNLKKIIKSTIAEKINSNRANIGIRSLEQDLALFNAIAILENLKYKDFFRPRIKCSNLLYSALFTSALP